MVNITWLAALFFSVTLLLEFGVDSMKSQPGPGEIDASSSNPPPGNRKRILLLVDKFLTHYNFAVSPNYIFIFAI